MAVKVLLLFLFNGSVDKVPELFASRFLMQSRNLYEFTIVMCGKARRLEATQGQRTPWTVIRGSALTPLGPTTP